MTALLKITTSQSLMGFLGFVIPEAQKQQPSLKVVSLRGHTVRNRARILMDKLYEQNGSRIHVSHPALIRMEQHLGFALNPDDPHIPFWDGLVLNVYNTSFIFGVYSRGTPDFSSLQYIRRFAERSAVSKVFDLNYENTFGLLIPTLDENGKLKELEYYFR